MKCINSAICKDMIGNLTQAKSYRGITLSEEIYLQALRIALPILERQESEGATNE